MKVLSVFFLLFYSSLTLAQRLPAEDSPCAFGSNCMRIRNGIDVFSFPANLLNNIGVTDIAYPGVYYQRATGRNCAEAQENARDRLVFNHPEFECQRASNPVGIACEAANIGPRLVGGSCMRSRQGETVAWIVCDTSRDRVPRTRGNPGAGLILIRMAQENERKARASR